MTNLNITERRKNDVLILDLDGKIRLGEDCSHLRQTLRLKAEEKKILLNLENVSYIDSSGLGELVASYITFEKNGGTVKLVNLSSNIHELMMLTKLLTIFDAFDSEAEAIDSFDNPKVKTADVSRLV